MLSKVENVSLALLLVWIHSIEVGYERIWSDPKDKFSIH